MRAAYSRPEKTPEQLAVEKIAQERNSWKRCTSGWTRERASDEVKDMVALGAPWGKVRRGGGYSDYIEVSRSFGVEVTIYIRYDSNYNERMTNPDDANQSVRVYAPHVELNWGTCGSRGVAHARAQVALYTAMIDLAAQLEVTLQSNNIYEIFDLSK